ncbi:hypothetical protein O6H91_04G069000 [Diphasiastrum complanatum]|uniref:Uncharacterized protein n=1 Tax=Diphasiastrum complanatum TaxID=34168 RepID=A0ACC2DXX1_DIPCM|nr:hypothetical protein O6H91_04G069000 [Diphasiastrum complanatum]
MTEKSAPFLNGFTISSKDASSKAFPAVLPNLEISKVAQQRLKFVYPSCVVSASSLSNPQNSASATTSGNHTPQRSPSANDGHQCPSFALTLYPLLEELHSFYSEMPDIQHSMRYAQKMLFDIESGREVDKNDLAQAQKFRLAVEGLRVALNSAARRSLKETQSNINVVQFENLSYDDKCHLVLVQALQQQLKKFTTVVAVMDASSLAGIRKYWNTVVTPEVALLAEQCFACSDLDAVNGVALDSKKLEKQFAMVGASTVTAMGIASLSWWAPFSSFTKILILKVPTVAKLGLMQTKRNAMLAAFKVMYPAAKVATPGKLLLSPASQVSMMMKTATSAGKARAISHSLVTTAERASLSAIRTAFYCLMRKHHGKSTGIQPWLMLGSTVAVGAGVLANGKAIESAIEAAPAASAVARLGRGLENLQHAFLALSQDDQMPVWTNLYNSLYGLSKH